VQDRHREAHGLAGAGAGLTDEVVVLDRQRDGEGLDRERVDDVVRGQCIDDVSRDAEVGERLEADGLGLGVQNSLLVVPRPFVDPTPALCRGIMCPALWRGTVIRCNSLSGGELPRRYGAADE
jgi:hypothetical protein